MLAILRAAALWPPRRTAPLLGLGRWPSRTRNLPTPAARPPSPAATGAQGVCPALDSRLCSAVQTLGKGFQRDFVLSAAFEAVKRNAAGGGQQAKRLRESSYGDFHSLPQVL